MLHSTGALEPEGPSAAKNAESLGSQALASDTAWRRGSPRQEEFRSGKVNETGCENVGEAAASNFPGPDAHPLLPIYVQHRQNEGKSTSMKNNHFQPGANLLKRFVLNPECYFSFQSGVIKCASAFQEEERGRLTIIKSLLHLAPNPSSSGLLSDNFSKTSI